MIFKIKIAVFILIAGMCNLTQAIEVYECNGCTTSNYTTIAKNATPNTKPTTNIVYVSDVVNNVFKKFEVHVIQEEGMTWEFAVPKTAEANYQSMFDDHVTAYNEYKNYDSPYAFDYPDGSAYGIGGNNQLQSDIAAYIRNNTGWYNVIANYLGTGIALLGKIADVNMVSYINFPDGTSIEMRIVGLGENGQIVFEYNPDSALDAEENSIPDSAGGFENFSGTFNSTSSLSRFLAYASSMGVPITTGSGSGGQWVVSCTTNNRGVISCVARKVSD